jgi:hypothetical protein
MGAGEFCPPPVFTLNVRLQSRITQFPALLLYIGFSPTALLRKDA